MLLVVSAQMENNITRNTARDCWNGISFVTWQVNIAELPFPGSAVHQLKTYILNDVQN